MPASVERWDDVVTMLGASSTRAAGARPGGDGTKSPGRAPYAALADVATDIADQVRGKVVADLTNPGPATEGAASAAEQLAESLPGAYVAKAFNTLFGSFMAQPALCGQTVDALFATDSDEARARLAELISSFGFRPIDAGTLTVARQMEAIAWLNIQLQMRYGGDWSSTFILLGAPQAAIAEPTASRS